MLTQVLDSLRVVAFAALASLIGAFGCTKPEQSTASNEKPAANAAVAGPKLAVQLGYQKIGAPFLLKSRAEGLTQRLGALSAEASWKEFKTGPALLEAINAGEVDVGYVGETPPIFAQAAGTPFVYVATDPAAPKAEAIIVHKDSPLKSLADLKGKKIAFNRGSNVHYLLLKALESVQLTLKDVEVVYLAPGDARPAFDTGKVDAWVIWDPFLAAAELDGARALTDGQGLVDNHLFYVVRRAFAEAHPDVVKEVIAEYKVLSDWESQHPEDSARLLAQSSGVSYEALLRSEQRHTYGILPINSDLLAKQQAIADAFRKLDLIPKDIRTTDALLPNVVYAATNK